jgi:CubicO group peptidase (beta-lactamase class C family)
MPSEYLNGLWASGEAADELLRLARDGVESGLLLSCQLAVARFGQVVLSATLGAATPTSRYALFSASKPVLNSAIWMLIGERRLSADTLVAELIPEFATNGKDGISVEQLLTQTAGIPHAPMRLSAARSRSDRLQQFSAWRLNWPPGTCSEYHPTSAHWVLAELVERVADCDYRQFIAERIAQPLGLPNLAPGVPESEQAQVVDLVPAGEPAAIPGRDLGEITVAHQLAFNRADVRATGIPAASIFATAGDLALFYQELLFDIQGLWDPPTLLDAKTRIRNDMFDLLQQRQAYMGLGIYLQGPSSVPPRFGVAQSPGTFGWPGAGGQIAWADPATGLSFVYLTNSIDQDHVRLEERSRQLSTLAGRLAK